MTFHSKPSKENPIERTVHIKYRTWQGHIVEYDMVMRDVGQYEGGDKYTNPVAMVTGNVEFLPSDSADNELVK